MNQTTILGALITLCSGLLWRKLDAIDKRIDGVEKRIDGVDKTMEKLSDRLTSLMGDFREFKGKVEALLGREKKHSEPASEKEPVTR